MCPRSAAQFEALREESRARLLDAALHLFATRGYARTTVRDIARRAGVSQGLLYNYFAGKSDVLRAVFLRGMEQIQGSFRTADEAGEPLDRITSLLEAALRTVRAERAFWLLFYSLRTQPTVLEDLAPELAEWTEELISTLERYVAEAGSPEPRTDALILFALVDGAAQHAALRPWAFPADEVLARVAALLGRPRSR